MSEILDLGEYSKKAEAIVNSIGIPTQPKIVIEVNKAINDPDANLESISEIISKDVSMSAKVLKVSNSPFFGLKQPVDSISRAISVLGVQNFNRIILNSAMRETLGTKGPEMEKFWDHSIAVATIASDVATKVGMPNTEQAYTAGLFHDCGVPLMMKKYKDYPEVVDFALSVVSSRALAGDTPSIIGIEDERYNTNHCAIGYIVAKSWKLSTPVLHAIWYHHYIHLDIHNDEETRRLTAILLLADYICAHILYMSGGKCPVAPEAEWIVKNEGVLSELSLSVDDIKDMREDSVEKYMSPA